MISDARVRYTKMVIRNAFLNLLNEKPINQVTVKRLCELAEINRATFYSHYADVYDLLEQIQEELYNEIQITLSNDDPENLHNIVLQVLQVISNNEELCKVLFSDHGDKAFFRKIMTVGKDPCVHAWSSEYPAKDPEDPRKLYIYIANGSISLIDDWINSGMVESPETMGRIIGEISKNAIASLKIIK